MTHDKPAVSAAAVNGASQIEGRGPFRLAWERLRRDRAAMTSLVVIGLIVATALAAPLVAAVVGHGPNEQYRDIGLSADGLPVGPNATFLLGTDDLGRDLLVRIVYGGRISLLVGVVSTLLSIIVGVVVGVVAGYFGGFVDTVLARVIDVVLSIPFLLAGIAIVSVSRPSLTVTVVVIAFFSWSSVARLVRGQVLSIREREYIEAARSLGASDGRIMVVDVLPNVLAPVIVYTTLLIPAAIVAESTLSFLGLGVPAADGHMGRHARRRAQLLPRRLVVPALPRHSPCWSRPWPSTCSATGCAMRSTRARAGSAPARAGSRSSIRDPVPRPACPAGPARHLAGHAGAVRPVLRDAEQRRADPRRPAGHPADHRAHQPAAGPRPAAVGAVPELRRQRAARRPRLRLLQAGPGDLDHR